MKLSQKKSLALIFISALLLIAIVNKYNSLNSADAIDQTVDVHGILARLIGEPSEKFHLKLNNTESASEWFQIRASNGKVEIEATTQVALAYGAYHYLKEIGASLVSWEGTQITLPESFPNYSSNKIETPFKYRSYLNVCAYGYTTPWWNNKRWQQEIDWMALHGVNMPTAMEGQEIVWQKLWKEYDLSDAELANYFSGPAFLPWQRMGNIEGHLGPLPQNWIDKKHIIQKKLLGRMRSLGMHPVIPAFGGYVPESFVQKYPDAKIYKMEPWSNGFKSTHWLDPADPLFKEIGNRFIELYQSTYGKSNYYLLDAFNEMLPPVNEANRYQELAEYGEALYQSIKEVNPNGVWVMQGWMFGHNKDFWTQKSIEAFLSKVPSESMIIQDIGNDRYGVWEGANAFYGQSWIYGYIHNYGGSNPVYGDFDFYYEQTSKLLENENKGNLVGFGAFPEGLDNNSSAYEYIFDLAWNHGEKQLRWEEWAGSYTRARYGKNSDNILNAWKLLKEGVFQTRYWQPRWWNGEAGAYLLFKRPSTEITNFEGHPGSETKLREAINILLSSANEYKQAPLFQYDLVDFSSHYLTLKIDSLLINTVKAYQNNNIKHGDNLKQQAIELINGVDLLLGARSNNLSNWLAMAENYGTNEEESAYYRHNAKIQITLWGGEDHLKDYASKAWQGMYKEFYLPRWKILIDELKQSNLSGEIFDETAVKNTILDWEKEWINDDSKIERVIPEDPLSLILELLQIADQK